MSRRSRWRPPEAVGTDPPSAAPSLPLSSAALALVILGLVLQWRRGNHSVGIDFYQFWLGGQAVARHRVSNLYSAYGREALADDGRMRAALPDAGQRLRVATGLRSKVETFSTPLLYSAFALFSGDYERSYQTWRALSLLALCFSVLLLGRYAALPLHWSLVLLAFILFLYQPLESEIRVANVNAMQLLMLAVGMSLLAMPESPRADVGAGVMFAVVTAFKPNVALTVPLLLIASWIQGRRSTAKRQAIGAILGGGLAIGVSSLLFGSWRCWLQWRRAAADLSATVLPRSAGNVAPLLPLQRYGPIVPAIAGGILVCLTIAALVRGRMIGDDDGGKAQLAAAVAVVIYLMTAPLVWMHYLLLALPLSVVLLGRSAARRSTVVLTAVVVALSALAIDPWSFVTRIPRDAVAPVTVTAGLTILFVLSLRELAGSNES